MPLPARWATFVLTSVVLSIVYLHTAERRDAFGSRYFEWRFRATGVGAERSSQYRNGQDSRHLDS